MADTAPKPPAFYCPECGQKHRADLRPLAGKAGAAMRTTCQGCGIDLLVRLEDGEPACEVGPTKEKEERPRQPPLEAGTRAGRYVIQEMVRRGATSTVYRAEDPETKRTVALKVLGHDAPKAARQAFLRQVEVQAKIRHPNILPVYDQGVLPDGRPFFTSEMLEHADTLEGIVTRWRSGRIAPDSPLASLASIEGLIDRVLIPVAEGIYVANVENDVLHGDLEPANVLIDGALLRPYVGDFGYAAPLHLAAEDGQAAESSRREATPWTAPEQARGQYHVRTDVWGLGALLAFVLSGDAPLARSPDLARAAAAARYQPLPDDAPSPLRAIVQKAMAPDPDGRYVNARQMAADLRAWRKDGWVRAVDEFGGTEAARIETRQVLQRIGRGLLWVGGGLLVGLLVGSFFEWSGDSGPGPRVTEAARAVERLDAELTRLAAIAPTLTPTEAARVWASLQAQAGAAADRLEQAPPSSARSAVEERIAFVRERFAPPPLEVEGDAALKLKAHNLGTGKAVEIGPGQHALPPGPYDVSDPVGGRLRFPSVVPFAVRDPSRGATTPPRKIVWRVPKGTTGLPQGTRLVLGGAVTLRRLPYAKPEPGVDVAAFQLDWRPVTKGAYLKFLQALPAADRGARLPTTDFELNAERGTIRVVGARPDAPVLGVSPRDARAYCTWASEREDALLRLPTEAEWILALANPLPGTGEAAESDYGIAGLKVPALELVTGDDGVLLKGKTPNEAAVYAILPVGEEERRDEAGFRCVHEPKP